MTVAVAGAEIMDKVEPEPKKLWFPLRNTGLNSDTSNDIGTAEKNLQVKRGPRLNCGPRLNSYPGGPESPLCSGWSFLVVVYSQVLSARKKSVKILYDPLIITGKHKQIKYNLHKT